MFQFTPVLRRATAIICAIIAIPIWQHHLKTVNMIPYFASSCARTRHFSHFQLSKSKIFREPPQQISVRFRFAVTQINNVSALGSTVCFAP